VHSYELETARIRSGRGPVIIAVVAAALIVAAAVAGTVAPRPAAPATLAGAGIAAVRYPDPSPVPATTSAGAIVCDGLRDAECLAAVNAARRAVGDVDVALETAHAWPTLLCRDDLDCPRTLMETSRPVGSVVLTFAHIGAVWVNVFGFLEPNRLNENREVLAGRVVRWLPSGS
jgi:hypothetical protein